MELRNSLLLVRTVVPKPNDRKQASKATFQKNCGVHHHRDEDSSEENNDEEDSSEDDQMQQLPGDPKLCLKSKY